MTPDYLKKTDPALAEALANNAALINSLQAKQDQTPSQKGATESPSVAKQNAIDQKADADKQQQQQSNVDVRAMVNKNDYKGISTMLSGAFNQIDQSAKGTVDGSNLYTDQKDMDQYNLSDVEKSQLFGKNKDGTVDMSKLNLNTDSQNLISNKISKTSQDLGLVNTDLANATQSDKDNNVDPSKDANIKKLTEQRDKLVALNQSYNDLKSAQQQALGPAVANAQAVTTALSQQTIAIRTQVDANKELVDSLRAVAQAQITKLQLGGSTDTNSASEAVKAQLVGMKQAVAMQERLVQLQRIQAENAAKQSQKVIAVRDSRPPLQR